MAVFPRALESKFLADARRERLAGPIYAAMVDNLFGTLVGFAALGFASVLLATLTFAAEPGLAPGAMLAAIVLIVVLRTLLMIEYHRWKKRTRTRILDVVDWEIAYAAIGTALMLMIGIICAYNLLNDKGELALIVSIVVEMGIAGCIAGRNGSRPRIVWAQLCTCLGPSIVVLLLRQTAEAYALSGLIVLFVLATMSSVRAVYTTLRSALEEGRQKRMLSKRFERTANLLDAALNNMTSGLLLFDHKRCLVVANERVKEFFGRELVESWTGRPTAEISEELYEAFRIDKAEAQSITEHFKRTMIEGGEATFVIYDQPRGRSFEMRLRVMADGRAVFNVDDVTEQRAKDREIFRLAHYDVLTGLHNRVSLIDRLRATLRGAGEREVAIMYIDLDRFKEVNDDLGHAAGDEVLTEVARRLSACVRQDDFLARIGGDEFVLIVSKVEDRAAIDRVAHRLIAVTSAPFIVGGKKITLGASAGLYLSPKGGEGVAEEALRLADVALYEAKFRGRGQAVWYESGMDDRIREHREMVVDLREALATGRGLSLNYQPVFDCRNGRIVACEALARWTHPTYGKVPPSTFIPLAEENNLIGRLGRWCLEQACFDALDWPDDRVKVAVNVSGLQFHQDTMVDLVRDVLFRTQLAPRRLELEVTESVLATEIDRMTFELKALASQGVSIALDDFGTGFSSLSLVHKLPFDKVKLDRSFVAQLDTDTTVVSLIASIIRMLRVMNKEVVIEGVETAQQLAIVTSAQARLVQGFYFSYPLPQADLLTVLHDNLRSQAPPSRRAGL